jgi:hypothetical protein
VLGFIAGLVVAVASPVPADAAGQAVGGSPEASPLASARLEHARVLSYPFEQVWPTALRYLRIDRGYIIVDRDAEAGYVLFEFPADAEGATDAAASTRGSLEMFARVDPSGRPSVSVSIGTEGGPSHLPHAIADGLAAKLKRERGQPAPPPPKAPAPPSGPTPPKGPPPTPPETDEDELPILPPAIDPSEL